MKYKKYITIFIGLIVLAVLIYKANFIEVTRVIGGLNKQYLLFAFILYLPLSLLRPFRWKLFISSKTNFSTIFKIAYLGYIANRFLPSRLGALLRAVLLSKKYKIRMGYSLASIFLDNMVVILYICLSSFAVSSFFVFSASKMITQMVLFPIIFIAAMIIGFIVLYYALKSRLVTRLFLKFKKLDKLRKKYGTNLMKDFKNYFLKFNYRNLTYGVLVTIIIWLNMSLVNFFIIKASGHTIPIVFLYLASTLPAVIGIITLIPGGFGTQELSIVGILMAAGLSLPVATSVALLNRFIELIWIGGFGIYSSTSLKVKLLKE